MIRLQKNQHNVAAGLYQTSQTTLTIVHRRRKEGCRRPIYFGIAASKLMARSSKADAVTRAVTATCSNIGRRGSRSELVSSSRLGSGT
jgi:hypothetical protein